MKFKIHSKERLYFGIMSVIGILGYSSFAYLLSSGSLPLNIILIYLFYIALFLVFRLVMSTFLIGHIKGNAIKISKNQFPDVFDILQNHSQALGLKEVPSMYVLQGNGVLNAFATRFARKNFVVLYSAIFEMAYEEGMDAVSFIIGHELGHIKRKHISFAKSILTFPSIFVPFLNSAYSRTREYTCDNIGCNLAAKGAISGLLILAAGKKLYKKINISNFINNTEDHSGFAFWLAEKLSTHPHLVKRMDVLNKLNVNTNDLELDKPDFISPKINLKNTEIQQ